jgi:hypothetical protein
MGAGQGSLLMMWLGLLVGVVLGALWHGFEGAVAL